MDGQFPTDNLDLPREMSTGLALARKTSNKSLIFLFLNPDSQRAFTMWMLNMAVGRAIPLNSRSPRYEMIP